MADMNAVIREQQQLIDAYRAALAATDEMVAAQAAMIDHLYRTVAWLEAAVDAAMPHRPEPAD